MKTTTEYIYKYISGDYVVAAHISFQYSKKKSDFNGSNENDSLKSRTKSEGISRARAHRRFRRFRTVGQRIPQAHAFTEHSRTRHVPRVCRQFRD